MQTTRGGAPSRRRQPSSLARAVAQTRTAAHKQAAKQHEFYARRAQALRQVQLDTLHGKVSPVQARDRLQQMGFVPGGAKYMKPRGLPGLAAKFIGDLTEAAYYTPGGVAEVGHALYRDTADAKHGDLSFKRSRRLGVAMGKATAADIRHPLRHPGYTFLDALAIGSAGAGTASRVGGAARAVRAGEGLARAAARPGYEGGSLLHRPIARETTLRSGGLEVKRLEPDNPLLRPAHRLRTRQLQRQLDKPKTLEPRGTIARTHERFAGGANIVGRELRAEQRVTADLGRAPAARVRRVEKGMSREERTAVRIVAVEGSHALRNPEEAVARQAAIHRSWANHGIEPRVNEQVARDVEAALPVLKARDPGFLRAMAEIRRLSKRGEREGIARGLLTRDVAGRHKVDIARVYGSPGIMGGEHFALAPRGSFYFPTGERFKLTAGRGPSSTPYSPRPSQFGVGPADKSRFLQGTMRKFTGASLRRGVVEQPGKAIADVYAGRQRLYSAHDLIDRARAASTETRETAYQIPIRDKRAIPAELRQRVDAILTNAAGGDENAAARAVREVEQALRAEEHVNAGIGTHVAGVRWVDRRLLKEISAGPRSQLEQAAAAVNKPFRVFGIYLRPAYFATNYPGNVGMGAVMQGPRIVANMRKGHFSRRLFGAENDDFVGSAMGTARTQSYEPRGRVGRVEAALVSGITHATDSAFRKASFYYRAGERGYKTRADLTRLRTDPASHDDLMAIVRRARKDAVDFDSLAPAERQLAEAIYFYPWLSRATAWTGRTVMNRPVKAAAGAQGARIAKQHQRDVLGVIPRWLQGYITTRFGLVNPTSMNTPATPAQVLDYIQHPQKDSTVAEEFGTPLLQLLGSKNPGQIPGRMIGSTGVGAVAKRLGADAPALLGPPSKTFPQTGPVAAVGPFMLGGWFPRRPDMAAVHKQGAAELPTRDRIVFKYAATVKALPRQAKLLAGKGVLPDATVPRYVSRGFELAKERELAFHEAGLDKQPSGASQAQKDERSRRKALVELGIAEKAGTISGDVAATVRRVVEHAPADQLSGLSRELWGEYGYGQYVSTWNSYVRHYSGGTP